MKLIGNIAKIFFDKNIVEQIYEEHENNNEYKVVFKSNTFETSNNFAFKQYIERFVDEAKITGDSLTITFEIIDIDGFNDESSDPYVTNSKSTECIIDQESNDFIKYVKSKEKFIGDEKYSFRLEFLVTRSPIVKHNVRRIYSFKLFKEKLLKSTLSNIVVDLFSGYFEISALESNRIIFIIEKDFKEFYSKGLFFVHSIENVNKYIKGMCSDLIDNEEAYKFYKDNSSFNIESISITPYFFKLIKESEFSEINEFFNKLLSYISLVYLSDYATIANNSLVASIKGYTSIEIKVDFNTDDLRKTSVYSVFDWVYSQDKREVKLEIARNILSLEYGGDIFNINENVLNSIESNYVIYSQDNVQKYIELKLALIKSITETEKVYSDSIRVLVSKFKNSMGLVITFFLTTVIFNFLGNGTDNFFTFDLAIISIVILIGAFVFVILNVKAAMVTLYKYHNSTLSIYESYRNLLADNDIKKTLSSFYSKDTFEQIQSEILYHTKLGLGTLIALIIVVSILTPEIRGFILEIKIYQCFLTVIILIILFMLIILSINKGIIKKQKFDKTEAFSTAYNIFQKQL